MALVGFGLTTLMVIGTDCTCSCKSNYHTITTTAASIIHLDTLLNNMDMVSNTKNKQKLNFLDGQLIIQTNQCKIKEYFR